MAKCNKSFSLFFFLTTLINRWGGWHFRNAISSHSVSCLTRAVSNQLQFFAPALSCHQKPSRQRWSWTTYMQIYLHNMPSSVRWQCCERMKINDLQVFLPLFDCPGGKICQTLLFFSLSRLLQSLISVLGGIEELQDLSFFVYEQVIWHKTRARMKEKAIEPRIVDIWHSTTMSLFLFLRPSLYLHNNRLCYGFQIKAARLTRLSSLSIIAYSTLGIQSAVVRNEKQKLLHSRQASFSLSLCPSSSALYSVMRYGNPPRWYNPPDLGSVKSEDDTSKGRVSALIAGPVPILLLLGLERGLKTREDKRKKEDLGWHGRYNDIKSFSFRMQVRLGHHGSLPNFMAISVECVKMNWVGEGRERERERSSFTRTAPSM